MTRGSRAAHIVVVTIRTILVALLVCRHVLPKRLLAFLAQERHLRRFRELVLLLLSMAFRAVKPLLAARCAHGDLRVQDMFAREGFSISRPKSNVAQDRWRCG